MVEDTQKLKRTEGEYDAADVWSLSKEASLSNEALGEDWILTVYRIL